MKIARKDTGEKYIETPAALWGLFFKAWMLDKKQPAPMPQRHKMFAAPEHYSASVYDKTKRNAVNQATDVLVEHGEIL